MNDLVEATHAYDVVIHATEARYWYFLIGSVLAGFLAVQGFAKISPERRDGALKSAGYVLLAANLVPLVYGLLSPDQALSWHRSLPIHFCGLNGWLIALNCFWRNSRIFTFTAFLGTIGGMHALLTPQLTIGDAPAILVHYYFNHTSIVVVPMIMSRSYGFRFPEKGWMWTYVAAAVLSTSVGVFNWYLNTYHPVEITANYMYMWEAPKVDNPFVKQAAWPWYILPLHVALVFHLVVINAAYRLGTGWQPAAGATRWRRLLH